MEVQAGNALGRLDALLCYFGVIPLVPGNPVRHLPLKVRRQMGNLSPGQAVVVLRIAGVLQYSACPKSRPRSLWRGRRPDLTTHGVPLRGSAVVAGHGLPATRGWAEESAKRGPQLLRRTLGHRSDPHAVLASCYPRQVIPLTLLPATTMATMVRRKEVSPVELVEAHLSRIEKLNPLLNAFVRVDAERSRQSARTAEAAVMRGEPARLLHGVPLTIKSSIDVAGLPSETGSRLRAGRMAPADAPIVARLKAAGAVIMGNTNAPEMLMSWETDNSLYGRTNNPWDLERTAGGSSGGESAAIAAGLSAAGVGSDGGGSSRVPAHFTGICGLKPTPGRIPSTGHYPPSLGPFSLIGVVGPIARTVSDLCAMFEVLTGPDDGDPISSPVPLRWPDEAELRKIRIGYFEDDDRSPVTPETRAAVRTVAHAIKQSGFEVEPFRPDVLQRARDFWWVIFGQSGGFVLRPTLTAREDEISPTLKNS